MLLSDLLLKNTLLQAQKIIEHPLDFLPSFLFLFYRECGIDKENMCYYFNFLQACVLF
jgi:hypothetical protein